MASGLIKAPAGLDGIHGDLRAGKSPQPPEVSAHFPAGFIPGDAGTVADPFDQGLISRLGLLRHSLEGLAEPTARTAQA